MIRSSPRSEGSIVSSAGAGKGVAARAMYVTSITCREATRPRRLVRQNFTPPALAASAEKLDLPSLQVVHRSHDLDGTRAFKILEHGAAAMNGLHRKLDVLTRDRVYEVVVLCRTLATIFGCAHGGAYLAEQGGEISELHVVDRTLYGSAGRVSHHQNDLRTGHLAPEFHAPDDVVVGDVAGHAHVEGIAYTQVHDRLGGGAGIDAAQYHCRGVLAFGARLLLSEVIVRRLLAQAEALIAVLHVRDNLIGCQLVTLCLRQRGAVCDIPDRHHADGTCYGCDTCNLEEVPAVQMVAAAHDVTFV